MGADIYYDGPNYKEEEKLWEAYQSATDEEEKETLHLQWKKSHEQLDEEYFRDSYNNGSVFWQMDLSWWADVGKVLDKESRLPIPEAMKLRKIIEKRPIVRRSNQVPSFWSRGAQELTEAQLDEWFEYFTEKRQVFLNMLDRSIEYNAPLICSV